ARGRPSFPTRRSSDLVALGAGSVAVAAQILEAVAEPGVEVLYAWRSFEAYPLLADLAGATSVTVPLRDETHDLEAMADAVTPRRSEEHTSELQSRENL